MIKLDTFTRAYIECLLFTTNEDDFPEYCYSGEFSAGEEDFKRFSQVDLASMQAECRLFQRFNRDLLAHAGDEEQNGRDFAYTRNGHGVGFWDRGYDKEVAEGLSQSARSFGEVYLYKKSKGKIGVE